MSYLKEKVAYLKGLAEGMKINDSTNEGKLLKAIIDVLDDVALSVEDIEEIQEELSQQVDTIDEDLAEIEKAVYSEEDCSCGCEDDEDEDDEDLTTEFECPHCNEKVTIDLKDIDDDSVIECPHCNKEIEIEWDCCCDECEDEENKE